LSESSPVVILDLLLDEWFEVEVLVVLIGFRSRIAEESLLVKLFGGLG